MRDIPMPVSPESFAFVFSLNVLLVFGRIDVFLFAKSPQLNKIK